MTAVLRQWIRIHGGFKAQFNTYIRDNLNECPTAKASAAGQLFVSTAANTVVARTVGADLIATPETSASTGYTDLATTGPTVTCTTSASALVAIYANMQNSSNAAWMSYAISGATTSAEVDNRAIQVAANSAGQRVGAMFFHSTILNPGTNTFRCKYRVSTSGTGTWSDRRILVIPM